MNNLDNIMINMINHFENQVNQTKETIIKEVGHLIYCPELDMILWTHKVSKRLYLIYMTDKHKEDKDCLKRCFKKLYKDIDVYDDDYYEIDKYLSKHGITL
jgi:hypothetical protein